MPSGGRIRDIPALDGIRGLLLPGVILIYYTLFLNSRAGLPGWMRHVGLFSPSWDVCPYGAADSSPTVVGRHVPELRLGQVPEVRQCH